jgi:hypothetical protein
MKRSGGDTPLNTLRHRMGVVEGAALALRLEPLLIQYIGTSKVFLVATKAGNFRGRMIPKTHTDLYRQVTDKIDYLPKVLHTKELDKIWHVEFIEWFEGIDFKRLKPFGIPPEFFRQFGSFMNECESHGIGLGDCNPANIFHAWDQDITFQCDVDMFNRTMKHTPVCIKKFLRGATPEQQKAFYDGYR